MEYDEKCPPLTFSGDEGICARVNKDGIVVLDGSNLKQTLAKLPIPGIKSVSVAPTYNKSPFKLATYAKQKKQGTGVVKSYYQIFFFIFYFLF